jgi:hypothetical protein
MVDLFFCRMGGYRGEKWSAPVYDAIFVTIAHRDLVRVQNFIRQAATASFAACCLFVFVCRIERGQ